MASGAADGRGRAAEKVVRAGDTKLRWGARRGAREEGWAGWLHPTSTEGSGSGRKEILKGEMRGGRREVEGRVAVREMGRGGQSEGLGRRKP